MAGDMEIGARVTLDTQRFENGVAGINRGLRLLDSEFNLTSERARLLGNSVEQLQNKLTHLNEKFTLQGQKVEHYRQKIEQARQKQEQLQASNLTLAVSMERLETQYNQAVQNFGRNSQEAKQLKQELKQLQAEYTSNGQALQRLNTQIDNNTIAMNRAETAQERIQNEIRETNRELAEQQNRLHRTGERMRDTGNKMQDVGGQVGTTFAAMTGVIGAGLAMAVKESMNFEQKMADIQAVSGATGDEMKKISELAVQMGEKTKYSSVEAGQGIEELIKAGVSLTDIINGGLEGALNLATAGELELGDAAEIASTALNAFKDDNLSVAQAADLLAGAANASATSVGEVKFGLSMVSAVAAGVGLSFKDTTTALALFAQNGLKGSDAGTSLKTMLANLIPKSNEAYDMFSDLGLITIDTGRAMQFLGERGIKPTSNSFKDVTGALSEFAAKQAGVKVGSEKAEKAFQKLTFETGIMTNAFFDSNGNLKEMSDISEILRMAMQGLTAEQRQSYMYTLFGSDAIRAANILYKEGSDGVKNMYTEMSKVTALEVAETKMNTTKGKIEELSGAVDTLKKSFGDALLPILVDVVASVQGVVDWFNNLDESTQQMIAKSSLLALGIAGVTTALGFLAMGVGALLANPIALAITGVILGVGALGIALFDLNEKSKQTESQMGKFGQKVSDATSKAAGAYVDLKDKAINNMMDLKLKTGEEANKAADETIKAFQRMTNEVIKELEGKKSDFNKMFNQLMGVVPEGAKESLTQVKNEVIAAIDKEMEVATQAGQILEEGIKRYQGDTMKMPKDFAQKFDQALQVADKNVKQFYTKAKEITSISKEIEAGGMLSVDAGKKRFESIIKVYDEGVKSLEKQTKGWRENAEKMFNSGKIQPEKRKALLDTIALYEAKHVSDLQTIRGDAFKKLEEHLKAEDASIVLANANKIEAESKGWAEKTKAYLFGKETYEEVSNRFNSEQELSEKKHKDKLLEFELQYGKSKIESIGMYVSELQKGTESSKLLAESMAKEVDGKMKIDLGPAGQFTIDTFLQKLQKGELDSSAVATANANKLKDVYKVDLSQSGIESMQKWIEGIKTKDTGEVREFLSKNMQGNTTIDLGIYGKMTMDSWITGLQTGTLSFDTVFQFFQQSVKNGMNVDTTQEGQNNIQTLINGMQIGALSLPQVAQTMGLDIKSNVQVDLGAEGTFTVESLIMGMQSKQIDAETAAKVIKELIASGAKLDATQIGFDITGTLGTGLGSNPAPVNAATKTKSDVQGILASTSDGGGGVKAGAEVGNGIMSKYGYIKGSALDVVAAAHEAFNTMNGNPAGQKGGQGVANSIVNQKGYIRGSALEAITSAHDGFNTINGRPYGDKGGSEFSSSLSGTSDKANVAGKAVADKGKSGMDAVKGFEGVGKNHGEGYGTGISKASGFVKSMAIGLASSAVNAMTGFLKIFSPSRLVRDKVGIHFGSGFAVGIQSSTDLVENESRALGRNAYQSLANQVHPNHMAFAGVQMANGIAEGIKTQYSVVRNALQDTVSGAIDSIRSIKPEEIFSFQGDDPLTKYFNAIFVDGDWQNDWITHIPESMRDMVREIGRQMERFEGLSTHDVGNLSRWREVLSDNPNVIQYRPDNDNPDKQPYIKPEPTYIEIPVILEGREIARVSHPYVTEYQNRAQARNSVF
ncbi:phage tail tape measure protein [Bacillus cereus]|uniref:phage tail tape measure protein n=1 Tax=Bacillus cereus TaxID=1396 RepID=UPI000BEE7AA5|nr:phage tail tape measure protein [Bacillus cereus]PEE32381.1 phage tail tape measure protein [Bacillus cereus]PET40702.1 phage tail tape measure protein [Bacillus cereus]PFA39028.1 phage tail tape measure protein [Bacillus cereus]PFD63529.1 phage tail tape measure protein [Bacillus cereus]PFE64362.1 phage tail tape measure protein [Bacillus cereus]